MVGSELISAAADKTVRTHSGLTPFLKIGRPGAQYLFTYLDTSGNVAESNETNNARSQAFTVVLTPAPEVTALSPTAGPEGGGTTVTISGKDLFTASAVKFGPWAV